MARRRGALAAALVACALAVACAASGDRERDGNGERDARRPNIVLILADDAGYADFGFQPSVRGDMASLTPHVDSLAADGARFAAFYTSGAVCSPSRAGMLIGRYQQRFGHERNLPPAFPSGLPLTETTVADHLRAAGYVTACVGKWHLGYPDAFHPNERGFDWFYGCLQGSRSYFPYDDPTPHRVLLDDREPTPEEGYVTDRLGDAAVRFVRANEERPFFLYLSFTAPHGPLEAKPSDLADPRVARIENERRRKYAALVKAMDDNVGKLLAALEEEGLARDTVVFFTNDNGGQTQTGANNAPLRGRKGTVWEGGIRVPAAVRWPERIAPGTVIDEPVIALDLLPTFAGFAGARLEGGLPLDGVDLSARLQGREEARRDRTLFWRISGSDGPYAVRSGDWKLVDQRDETPPSLFDLRRDVEEAHDLAFEMPSTVARLRDLAAAWESELVEPSWGEKL